MIITKLENDKEYAQKVLGVCGLKTDSIDGHSMRINVLVKDKEIVNVTYAKHYDTLMEGDIGPRIYMGSVLWKGSLHDKIVVDALTKLQSIYNKVKTTAFISLAVEVNDKEISIQSFETNISLAFMELYKGSYNTLHVDDNIELKDGWATAVVIAVLPFPLRIPWTETVILNGVNKHNLKHFTPSNIVFDDSTYKGYGKLGEVSALGESVRESRRRVYRTIDNLKAVGLMYRRDIGNDVPRIYDQLYKWGWTSG